MRTCTSSLLKTTLSISASCASSFDNSAAKVCASHHMESANLTLTSCIVFVANHGGEALSFLQTTRFWQDEAAENDSTKNAQTQTQIQTLPRRKQDLSIILMDMEMPVMDGLACTRQIRRLQRAGTVVPHVPIIAVSANARSEQQSQAVAAGVDDTVAKPFRISELMPKIARLCVGGAGGTVGAGGGGASNGAAQS